MPIKSYRLAIYAFSILPGMPGLTLTLRQGVWECPAYLDKQNPCLGEPLIPENWEGDAGKGERLRKVNYFPSGQE